MNQSCRFPQSLGPTWLRFLSQQMTDSVKQRLQIDVSAIATSVSASITVPQFPWREYVGWDITPAVWYWNLLCRRLASIDIVEKESLMPSVRKADTGLTKLTN